MSDIEKTRDLITSCKRCDDHAALQANARVIFELIQDHEQSSQQLKDASEKFLNWVTDEYLGDASDIMNDDNFAGIDPEWGNSRATEMYVEQEDKKHDLLQNILDLLTQRE